MKEFGRPNVFDVDPRAIEAHALFFQGEVEDWRIYRQEFGEKLQAKRIVRMMKDGKPHHIVWLERDGVDEKSGTQYKFHQAACSCIVRASNPQDMEPMRNCQAWLDGKIARAIEVKENGNSALFQQMVETYQNFDGTYDQKIRDADKVHQA
ncbi:MAG: hypothetical protein JWO96_525, partial [Candidatus Saccharibacteria bacterium]|nr:hypothetical protein [Candidatus Saccharibacteria bacterium]